MIVWDRYNIGIAICGVLASLVFLAGAFGYI
jgi:hypothetical protein